MWSATCTAGPMRWPARATARTRCICLGDLLLFLDYADSRQRDLRRAVRRQASASELIALRTAQRFDEARAFSRQLLAGLGGDPGRASPRPPRPGSTTDAVRGAARAGLPDLRQRGPARHVGGEHLKPGTACSTASGPSSAAGPSASSAAACAPGTGPRMSSTTTRTRPRSRRSARWTCSARHIPPAVPELLYDTVARRMERGSEALLDAIRRTQPRLALFGHVHQPLARAGAGRPHRVRQRRPLRARPACPTCWSGSGRQPSPV